jgi:hypothetical protein
LDSILSVTLSNFFLSIKVIYFYPIMKFTTQLVVTLLLVASVSTSIDAYVVPQLPAQRPGLFRRQAESALQMSFEQDAPIPTSFREAEVLGLRLMQEGNFQDALVGT